jgi:hypothetical protein
MEMGRGKGESGVAGPPRRPGPICARIPGILSILPTKLPIVLRKREENQVLASEFP